MNFVVDEPDQACAVGVRHVGLVISVAVGGEGDAATARRIRRMGYRGVMSYDEGDLTLHVGTVLAYRDPSGLAGAGDRGDEDTTKRLLLHEQRVELQAR